jgi:hypothetical protein
MPRIKPLPSLEGIDLAELQLTILAIFEHHHMDPEWRRCMRNPQIGDLIAQCGGAPALLREAIAVIRRRS